MGNISGILNSASEPLTEEHSFLERKVLLHQFDTVETTQQLAKDLPMDTFEAEGAESDIHAFMAAEQTMGRGAHQN